MHPADAEAVAAFAVSHAVAAVGVAGHAGPEAAQLHGAAHRLAVMAHAEAADRVPRILHHAAVEHRLHRVAAALVGRLGQATQAIGLADRVAGEAVRAETTIRTGHPAAEVHAHVAVAGARHRTVIAEVLAPGAALRSVEQLVDVVGQR